LTPSNQFSKHKFKYLTCLVQATNQQATSVIYNEAGTIISSQPQ